MSNLTPVMQETLDAIRAVMLSTGRRAVIPWDIAHHLYGHIPVKDRVWPDLRGYEPAIRKRLYVLRDLGLIYQPYEHTRHSFWRPVASEDVA